MIMYATIVVGTDGSAPARLAVQAAGEVAKRFGVARVHVVAGYRPLSAGEMAHLAHELPREFLDVMSSDSPGTTIADDAARCLRAMGLEAEEHAVAKSGADAILDVADELDADLVVVGSRGHGVGRRVLRGSVSTKVAHHAPCNVLIVHSPPDREATTG
jgi:nucleotide-binding universal stress UspA family protein